MGTLRGLYGGSTGTLQKFSPEPLIGELITSAWNRGISSGVYPSWKTKKCRHRDIPENLLRSYFGDRTHRDYPYLLDLSLYSNRRGMWCRSRSRPRTRHQSRARIPRMPGMSRIKIHGKNCEYNFDHDKNLCATPRQPAVFTDKFLMLARMERTSFSW